MELGSKYDLLDTPHMLKYRLFESACTINTIIY